MKRPAALTLLLSLALAVAAQKPDDPSPEPPPPTPVSLRITGKGTVAIDRMGRSAADYAAGVKAGTIAPSPLACDLAVKITNNTKEHLRVRMTGAVPGLALALKGKGEVATRSESRRRAGGITYAELPPGGSATIPLSTLSGFKSALATHLIPLEAGDYELSATFSTFVYTNAAAPPAVIGKAKGKAMGKAFGKNPNVLKTTEGFRLTVTAK